MALDPATMLWAPFSTLESNAPQQQEIEVTRNPNSDLDRNAFLHLLITQMRYQDPLNPMDDKAFIAQMAQFTALEQMQQMNAVTSRSQAFSLIGKEIVAEIYNTQTFSVEEVHGMVSGVVVRGNEAFLAVGDRDVALSDVVMVYDTFRMQNMHNTLLTSQTMALIGQYVQAVTVDSNFNPTGFIDGRVDSVKFSGGQPILVVGGREVFAPEVISVGSERALIGRYITYTRLNDDTERSGAVTNVRFAGDNVFLVVGSDEVRINTLNHAMEALTFVGRDIRHGTISGEVTDVVIRSGVVFLRVYDHEDLVAFTSVRGT